MGEDIADQVNRVGNVDCPFTIGIIADVLAGAAYTVTVRICLTVVGNAHAVITAIADAVSVGLNQEKSLDSTRDRSILIEDIVVDNPWELIQ